VKKIAIGIITAIVILTCFAIPAMANGGGNCTRIQDGILTYSSGHYLEGEPLQVGYDIFGYNYQSHMFVGSYANVYLGRYGFPPYEGDTQAYYQRLVDEGYAVDLAAAQTLMEAKWYWYPDVWLNMQWNDAWLSNKDCDGDGSLDRHYGLPDYISSGAWETNHMRGEGDAADDWTSFVKIVAVPDDATLVNGTWYDANGKEIGENIWGQFAIILDIVSGVGATYVSPAGPGFGKW
jgi:hypothetical protein